MTSPITDFKEYSAAIASKFLQTIVVVDDLAYFREEKEAVPINTEIVVPGPPKLVRGNHNADDMSSNVLNATEDEPTKEKIVDVAHKLDAKRLIEDFATKGMVCAVIKPADVEVESLQDKVYPIAENCDIVVFDWVLYGEMHGSKVRELICGVTKKSSSDTIQRLRLIVVYTGQEDLADIASSIETSLRESGQEHVTRKDDYTLESGPVRIAVYAKEFVPVAKENRELAARVVRIEQMPDRLIREFTDVTMGLVSNVAVGSMAALRANTHRILARFHRGLDAPFLAHRAMLPHPDDANDLLVYLIGAEITAVLQDSEVGKLADAYDDLDVIQAWIEMNDAEMANTPDRGFANKFSIRNTPEFKENLSKLLRAGFSDKSLPADFASMKDKPEKAQLTKKLSPGAFAADRLEHEFAALTTMKSNYRTKVRTPMLLAGTILKQESEGDVGRNRYWVCIQPVCDCVRLEGPRTFPFLELAIDQGNFNLVVPDDNEFVRTRFVYKPYKLKQIDFSPSNDGSGVVRGERDDTGVFFVNAAGAPFRWIGELKFEHAQRIINKFASIQSRVGLEESEWLRRSGGPTIDD